MLCFSCLAPDSEPRFVNYEVHVQGSALPLPGIPVQNPTLLTSKRRGALMGVRVQKLSAFSDREVGEQLSVATGSPPPTPIKPPDFTTSVASGRRCLHLSDGTGARTEAEYCVDAKSGQFRLKTTGKGGQQTVVCCPIMSIEEIYTIDDDEACFPKQVLEALSPEERAGLFLIDYSTDEPNAGRARICLVESSRASLDQLLQHLLQHVDDVVRANAR